MIVKIRFLRRTGKAALDIEIPDSTEKRFRVRDALDIAVKSGADLRWAKLSGAVLREGIKIVGENPIVQIGPIGSDASILFAYKTDKGVYMERGCFFDTRDAFEVAVAEKHGDNRHGKIYRAAMAMIDVWAKDECDE